ncbi:hypothetical protein [Hymenobacter rubidus]|uniref:hypothetical protein n=1 Tax=Hymenobacter rubidus TaxID=1441626 RepID=UPI00191D2407|nr:hypothetical protein [Hymenobacter rubidus]
MKAYSDDSCERGFAACAEGASSVGAFAARFRVSYSFVHQLRRHQRTTGSAAALPHRGGSAPLPDAAARAELAACVAQQPDATLDELRAQLAAGAPAGRTKVWQAVQALDLRRKKSVHAAERGTEHAKGLRRAFLEVLPGEDITRFKFVDERKFDVYAPLWPRCRGPPVRPGRVPA